MGGPFPSFRHFVCVVLLSRYRVLKYRFCVGFQPSGDWDCWVVSIGMDSESGEKDEGLGSSDIFLRADQIDLTSLDTELEKQLSETLRKGTDVIKGPKEEWQIDPSKLEIHRVIAQGTYGAVYRGTYDGKNVAGTRLFRYNFCMYISHMVYSIEIYGCAL